MSGKRVLLVDYDPKSLMHARQLLEEAGFNVSTCADGVSALDQYKSLSPDLVVLSAMLPKMPGFEVCSNIRKLPGGQRTPVVIVTDVYKGKKWRLDAINKYGATEYIEKPIADHNFISILKEIAVKNGADSNNEATVNELEERTVQFSRDSLSQMVREEVTGAVKPTQKKIVNDKPKSKDDISKKLEESLAGLELEIGKKTKQKPKPSETGVSPEGAQPLPAVAKEEPSTFTSEDLFTDVIASVERELESEKILVRTEPASEPGVATPPTPAVASATTAAPAEQKPSAPPVEKPVAPSPSSAPTVQMAKPTITQAKPAETKKAAVFDSELEKKLSSTLSGLTKEKSKTASGAKTVQVPKPKLEPQIKPQSPAAMSAKAQPEAIKPEPQTREPEPIAAAGPTIQLTKESVREIIAPAGKETTEGINFGQYLLLEKIATGGMAELFKAKRKGVEGFEKILAIKRILPHMSDNEEFVTMFIDEAKLAAQLTHHNICQIFDLGKIENSYYIAMEYVHGKDLRTVNKAAKTRNKQLPVELAVLVFSKILSALDYAHRKRDANGQPLNLVHRDVSPQNILISYEGEVKLVDFGIAKAATKVHVTQHGALKGKLLYMSPEQAWGRAVDKRTDIFSLGAVLYETLSGRPLFFDDNDTEVTILEKVREARIAPLSDINIKIPPDLQKILTKALKKNPDERYQSAYDMQKELDNLFYTEGYNVTSGTLAEFVRSLFPEEWGQEAGAKDTVILEKPDFKMPPPTGKPVAPPPEEKPAPVASKPKPAPAEKPKEPVVKMKPEPVVAAVSEPVPVKPEPPAAKPEPVPAPGAFRDISSPEIMMETPKKSFPMVAVGIPIVVVLAVVLVFLFRGKPDEATPPQTAAKPVEQSAMNTPTTSPGDPAVQPPASTEVAPPEATTTAAAEELQKKIEEEQKKLEAQKAEQKKAEEEKAKEEARNKEELAKQQAAEQKAAEEAKKTEPAPPPVQEEPKIAQAEPPQQQIVETAPPVAATPPPTAKETPKAQPAPSVKEGDLVELTPDVVKPVLQSKVDPKYPPAASMKKQEGTVILSVLINENGTVSDVKVLRGVGGNIGFNESASTAVKKWKFKPATKEGKRVKVWMTYPIVFKIQ